ncbi:hypothetical protein SAMN05421812_105311 [Asanoa hainanensis]|uniref:Uncharacterized protein n=1 Tax=Asanoa hainanensis TaxID=560556 RepID=A0A239MBT5_9ACTN|nr:hypothetical protein [Asanoa hainanensis]SNT40061.1 hypothetical protein SAMN05421812_105311 [Asanoa hainanensis]
MYRAVSRYLVSRPEVICGPPIAVVRCAYLFVGDHVTVGVERRTALDSEAQPFGAEVATLTVTGPNPTRLDLSTAAAAEMFTAAQAKTFRVEYRPLQISMPWVLWVYSFANTGLVIAESHLEPDGRIAKTPEWCDENVTGDPRFRDEQLALHPYSPAALD